MCFGSNAAQLIASPAVAAALPAALARSYGTANSPPTVTTAASTRSAQRRPAPASSPANAPTSHSANDIARRNARNVRALAGVTWRRNVPSSHTAVASSEKPISFLNVSIHAPGFGSRFESQADVDAVVAEFHRVHERVFAVHDLANAVECLNWRGRLIAHVKAPALEPGKEGAQARARPDRVRKAYFGNGHVDTAIYLGEQLPAGAEIAGPAVIEEATSTLVVYPGAVARVSAGGRYIVTPPAEG